MLRPILLGGSLAILGLLLAPSPALTNSSGPGPGLTGAPGDGTCLNCHTGSALNSGGGEVEIDAPRTYTPGASIVLGIEVTNSNSPGRQGFQVAVLDANDESVGTLQVTDATNTQFADGDPDYVTQTFSGTFETSWQVTWQAPSTDAGPVTVYASGLGGNGNASSSGDRVYTTSAVINVNTTDIEEEALAARFVVGGARPNPFRAGTSLAFELPVAAEVELRVFDVRGREVLNLEPQRLAAGPQQLALDGHGLRAGTYVYRLTAAFPTGHVT